MLRKKINTKDISVVVQGAIDKKNTPKCLKSIRKHLNSAEIILSTWEGSDVDGLDYDILIENTDPGSFQMSPFETNNVRRQISSTVNGLKKVKTKFALKLRSDLELTSSDFLKYFESFNEYNSNWHFLKSRIIIPNLYARDPRIWESPMCPSDFAAFGLTEDMLTLWDVPFPTKDEEKWFDINHRPKEVLQSYDILISRFNPEQFIWYGFVNKFKKPNTNHMFDIRKETIDETLYSFANNLVILSMKRFGLNYLKEERTGVNKWHIITYKEYLKIYNKFSNGHKFSNFINIERILLLPSFKQSYARLYHNSKRCNQIKKFIKKEFNFYLNPFAKS